MDWYSEDPRRDKYAPIATSIGYPVGALIFIADALDVTAQYAGDEPQDVCAQARDCSAIELCNAIPRYARDLFGSAANKALEEMMIRTSENAGEIVFALVKAGLLLANPEDLQEDFNGVCSFVPEAK